MKCDSSFLEWFEKQFGKRSIPYIADLDMVEKIAAGDKARMLLNEAREWDRMHEAALSAWCVKETSK